MGRQPARQLRAAPATSFEGRPFAAAASDTRYFNRRELRAAGAIKARPLGANFKIAKWDQVLNGLTVFREERPPGAKSPYG